MVTLSLNPRIHSWEMNRELGLSIISFKDDRTEVSCWSSGAGNGALDSSAAAFLSGQPESGDSQR